MVRRALGLAGLLSLLASSAGAVTIGPTPYTGFAGSPFDGVPFSSFYLEDFEDGVLNTTGVTATPGSLVLGPAPLTDSVDPAGHSFYSGDILTTIVFTFDEVALGALPTHVGIALTDVGYLLTDTLGSPTGGPTPVTIEAFDATATSVGIIGPFDFGDAFFDGGTAEDRFVGIAHAGGIKTFSVTFANSDDWEVDHLQYGNASVPEPGTGALLGLGLLGLALRRFGR